MTGQRKRQKPVRNENGDYVTPVSGLPAAPINWAPPCERCKTRTCGECHQENSHKAIKCRHCESSDLSEPHRCPDTIAVGTKESQVGTRQRCKCRQCGASWAWTVKPVAAHKEAE